MANKMKKLLTIIIALAFTILPSITKVKDAMYYKRQIQNQRYPYSTAWLVTAIQRGKAYIIELYMLAGFDSNASYSGTPLIFFPIYLKQPKCLDVLLKAGAKPDEKTLKIVKKSKDEYLKDLFTSYLK